MVRTADPYSILYGCASPRFLHSLARQLHPSNDSLLLGPDGCAPDDTDIIGKEWGRGDKGRAEGRELVGYEEAPENREDIEGLPVLGEDKDEQKEDQEARRRTRRECRTRVSLLSTFRHRSRIIRDGLSRTCSPRESAVRVRRNE